MISVNVVSGFPVPYRQGHIEQKSAVTSTLQLQGNFKFSKLDGQIRNHFRKGCWEILQTFTDGHLPANIVFVYVDKHCVCVCVIVSPQSSRHTCGSQRSPQVLGRVSRDSAVSTSLWEHRNYRCFWYMFAFLWVLEVRIYTNTLSQSCLPAPIEGFSFFRSTHNTMNPFVSLTEDPSLSSR